MHFFLGEFYVVVPVVSKYSSDLSWSNLIILTRLYSPWIEKFAAKLVPVEKLREGIQSWSLVGTDSTPSESWRFFALVSILMSSLRDCNINPPVIPSG